MKELPIVGSNLVALVDDDTFELAKNYSWRFTGVGYVGTGSTVLYLHHFVMGGSHPTKVVDHINKNKLDCRRENLRLVTQSENMHNSSLRVDNTSGAKGVDYRESRGKYRVRIKVNGYRHFIGYFASFEEAVEARNKAEISFNLR